MQSLVSYVLVYEDPAFGRDEETEATPSQTKMETLRRRFLVGMKKETLGVVEERVGKHIFVKVSCPEDRLCREAENTRIEMPLKGLILDNPDEEEEAEIEKKMKKIFNSEIKTDTYAAAPFQLDSLELFMNRENGNVPILWSSIRCLLVYNILCNINISRFKENGELPENIGLTYLLMVGAFKEGFCLHDPSILEPVSLAEIRGRVNSASEGGQVDLRLALSKKWGGVCRPQPIQEIRDYFGEKIAFYFAWVSTFMTSLWVPAILGLGVFIYGVTRRLPAVQSRGFLNVIEVVKSSSDNDLTPVFAAIICLWGTIFMEVWKRKQISLARKWHVDNFDHVEPDRPQFFGTKSEFNSFTRKSLLYYPIHKKIMKYLCSLSVLFLMVMLVFISVTSVILYRVYMTISYCGDSDATCDLLHGTILATLLNTLSIMVLGRIYEMIAIKLTEWENHQTMSEHNDALVIKLFAFQFANTYASLFYTAFFRRDFHTGAGIMGLDVKYTDNCGHKDNDNCMSLLSFQLLVLMVMKPFPKFVKDVLWPWIRKGLRHCKMNEIDDFTIDEGVSKQHYLLRELLKPSAEDFRLGEFTEKMIQYGYLVLFATSFPLAPALALIFNIFDFRIDSRRLLWWNRRPVPYRDNDIGIWFHIIDFINVCGVISNAFLIAFNSELGREESLYVKFAIIIGFEHFIFFMKFAISLLIPDVPTWVKNSQKKERYLLTYLLKKLNPSYCNGFSKPEDSFEFERIKDSDIQMQGIGNRGKGVTSSRWSY